MVTNRSNIPYLPALREAGGTGIIIFSEFYKDSVPTCLCRRQAARSTVCLLTSHLLLHTIFLSLSRPSYFPLRTFLLFHPTSDILHPTFTSFFPAYRQAGVFFPTFHFLLIFSLSTSQCSSLIPYHYKITIQLLWGILHSKIFHYAVPLR